MFDFIELNNLLLDKGYIRGPFGSSLRRRELLEKGEFAVYEQKQAIHNSREFRFFINQKKFNELKRFEIKENDLIISCSGTVGKISVINANDPKGIISQALLILRVDKKKILPNYLRYFLLTNKGQNEIINASQGSVQQNIAPRSVVEKILIPCPDLQIQKMICERIELIEENINVLTKVNKTIEEIIKSIFNSWFIQFDPFDKKIPKDWEYKKIDSIISFLGSGNRPKGGASVSENQIPSIGAENINFLGNYRYSNEKYIPLDYFEKLKKKNLDVKDYDILIYKDGANIGRSTMFGKGFPHKNCTINEHVFILRSNDYIQKYLYFHLSSKRVQKELISLNTASAQPGINQSSLKGLELLIPSRKILEKFNEIVSPMVDTIFNNCLSKNFLLELQNILIPKLISGQIELANERVIN